MSRLPTGHQGLLFFGSLIVLLSRNMPVVLAKCRHHNKTQSDLSSPLNHSRSDLRDLIRSQKNDHQNLNKDASHNASSYPELRWLDVKGAGNVDVPPTARKGSGRFFNDAKNSLDEMEDKIARRSFSSYGSRQRLAGAVSRAETEFAAARRGSDFPRGSYASASKPKLGGQRTNLGNQISAGRKHHRRFHGSPGVEVCAMKMLDLGDDVCGFVDHLVQLGKLLERRNLLLSIIAKTKINSGEDAPQTLSLFVTKVIEDLIASNTRMKTLIDNENFVSELKQPKDELFKSFNESQRKNETISENKTIKMENAKISSVKTETTTTSNFLKKGSTTLTNEPVNRLLVDDFTIGIDKNKTSTQIMDFTTSATLIE